MGGGGVGIGGHQAQVALKPRNHMRKHDAAQVVFRNWPNTVSESTVSNTELSELFALTEIRGESSVSSSQPTICATKRTHRVCRRTHRVRPQNSLSKVSSPKQYSRNSIPPVSYVSESHV